MLCMTAGPILISIMTATFSRSMTLNPQETKLMRTLDGDKKQSQVIIVAAKMIQLWWRGRMRMLWFNPDNEMSMRRLLDLEDEDRERMENLFCQLMEAQQKLRRFKNQVGYHEVGESTEQPDTAKRRGSMERNSSNIASALMLAYQQQKGTSLKDKVSQARKRRGSQDSETNEPEDVTTSALTGAGEEGRGGRGANGRGAMQDKSELNHRDYLAALSTLSDQVSPSCSSCSP